MTQRILDFSQNPVRLRMRMKQLVIQSEGLASTTIPFEDVAVIVVSHPQVTFSQACIAELANNGGVLIACNDKSLPVGMFVPFFGHHQPSRRIHLQINTPRPFFKRAWQQIVQAKIEAQSKLLQALFKDDGGLSNLISQVKSGDPANVEARAARRYWNRLFNGFDFKRSPEGDDPINRRLNFGYGVLRGIVARAICAAGFHPAIGLHHHNQYNPYCLADDLMEPFRPLVDQAVYQIAAEKKTALSSPLTPENKKILIEPLLGRLSIHGESRTIFDCVTKLVCSLVQFFQKEIKSLDLPEALVSIQEEKPF